MVPKAQNVLVKTVALFYIFENLCIVFLEESWIFLPVNYVQSVVMSYVM